MTADFYGFADFGGMAPIESGVFTVVMIIYLVFLAIMMVYAAAVYVIQSLGLYTIAKRRGIHHPGLAWVPVASAWVLGSISDQYQYVTKGRIRNRRKVLLGLMIAVVALLLIFVVLLGVSVFTAPEIAADPFNIASVLPVFGFIGVYMIAWILSIIAMVFMYIAYYDLFKSCNPSNAVLFLVLSIFFNFLLPFFVFACRQKDEGMPPRKIQVAVAPWKPVDNQTVVPEENPTPVSIEESAQETAREVTEVVVSEEDFEV